MNRLYSILIVAAMAFCMSGCSKDDGKEDNGKTDLPQYSIKIKKDGKTIFQGELHSGSLTYTPLKEAFMVVDMIVVPKYLTTDSFEVVEKLYKEIHKHNTLHDVALVYDGEGDI